MKYCKFFLLFFVLTAVSLLGSALASMSLPAPEGKAVIQFITKDNDYTKWSLWPGKDKLYPGKSPHGAFLTSYVNETAAKAIKEKSVGMGMPDGSIVVKENYSPDKKLAAVTVMYKKKGFDPDNGDWFYLKFSPDGDIDAVGKVTGCIGCHTGAKSTDYLFLAQE